jgi:hypothetical protein
MCSGDMNSTLIFPYRDSPVLGHSPQLQPRRMNGEQHTDRRSVVVLHRNTGSDGNSTLYFYARVMRMFRSVCRRSQPNSTTTNRHPANIAPLRCTVSFPAASVYTGLWVFFSAGCGAVGLCWGDEASCSRSYELTMLRIAV